MSTETQENIVSPAEDEQITKPKSATKTTKASAKKPKDPKKVAAGKKLAEHNRIERQALNRELKRDSEAEAKTEVGDSNSCIPNTSFATVLSVVDIGLTIFDLHMKYRKGASEAQTSRVDEKSSEAKVEVKAEAKEESVIEPVEKSQDTSFLTPSQSSLMSSRSSIAPSKKIRKTSRAKVQKLNVVWIKLCVVCSRQIISVFEKKY